MGVGNGYYELIPQSANGRRLDVAGSGSANGTNLDIWDASNNNAQKWKIMDQGNGYYELAPACAPGQRMDVAGFGNTNNTNTHIWQDGSNTAQRWKLIPKTINSNFASKANPLENTLKDFTYEKDATGFSIYPNPASSSIKIDLPNGEAIAELQISDLQGKVLLTKLLKKSQSVDIRHPPAGVYIVRLQRDDALHTRKLVVE